jgi:hypothetical protein
MEIMEVEEVPHRSTSPFESFLLFAFLLLNSKCYGLLGFPHIIMKFPLTGVEM